MASVRMRAIIAAVGAAVGITASAQAQLTRSWASPVSGNWAVNGNWSPGGFPNNSGPTTYNVFIAVTGATYAVTLDQDITVNDLSMTSSDAALNLFGSHLVMNGNYTLSTGALIDSTATGSIQASGAVTLGDAMIEWVPNFISQGTLTFNGLVELDICDTGIDHSGTACLWQSGHIMMENGSTFRHRAGSTFTVTSDRNMYWNGLGARPVFTNEGVFQKTTGSSVTFVDGVTFDNTGTLQVDSGTFRSNQPAQVTGNTLTAGTWKVSAGSAIDLVGANITTNAAAIELRDPGSSFNAINGLQVNAASGQLSISNGRNFTASGAFTNNGAMTIGGATTFTAPANFNLGSASVTGAGTLTVAGDMTLNGATTSPTLSGGLTLQSQGRLIFNGPTTAFLDNTHIVQSGSAIQWSGTGGIMVGGGTVLDQAASSTFSITNDQSMTWNNSGTRPVLNNAGTLTKSTGTGVTFLDGVTVNNTGTLQVQSGTLRANNVPVPGNTLSGGKWIVSGGSTLDLVGASILTNAADITLQDAGSTFAALDGLQTNVAAGKLTISNGRNFTTQAAFTNSGTLTVGSATTFQVASGSNLTNYNAGTNTLNGGAFALSGLLRFDNADVRTLGANVTLTGAASDVTDPISGLSGLRNLNTISSTGSLTTKSGRNFLTAGNFTVAPSGQLTIGSGTLFRVAPTFTMTNFAAGIFNDGGFNIAGTLQFDNAAIHTINNHVTLDGPGVHIVNQFGQDAFTVLTSIPSQGDLSLVNGHNLTIPSLNLSGKVRITGGGARVPSVLSVTGNFVESPSGILDLDDGGQLNVGGVLTLNGTVLGSGTINGDVVANGILSPGHSPGSLTIGGRLTVGANSILDIQLGGTEPGTSFDQLLILSTPAFPGELNFPGGSSGILRISLIDGFVPTYGQTFDLAYFDSASGHFSEYEGLDVGNGLRLEPAFLSDRLMVTVVPAPGSVLIFSSVLLIRRRVRRV